MTDTPDHKPGWLKADGDKAKARIAPDDGGSAFTGYSYPHQPGSKAVKDVLAERGRQINEEGWTAEHDDKYHPDILAMAAACYAANYGGVNIKQVIDDLWPFDFRWWKPSTRRRDLVKAGALILAEIERIDRFALVQADALIAASKENKDG